MYLLKTVWPVDLALNYTFTEHLPAAGVLGSLAVVAAITAAALWQARARPWIAVGWLWFLGVFVPMIGIVQTGDQAYADRYAYVPHVGLFLAVIWGLSEWKLAGNNVVRATGGLLLLVMLWTAHIQASYWKNPVTLWSHTVAVVPDHVSGHQILGRALIGEKRFEEARQHLETAIRMRPNSVEAYRTLAEAQFIQGQTERSLQTLDTALKVAPGSALTYYNRGIVLRALDRPEEAEASYRKGIELGLLPDKQAEAWVSIGLIYTKRSQFEQSIPYFQKAIEAIPYHFLARKNLGFAYVRTNRVADAVKVFEGLERENDADDDVKRSLRFLRNRR